MASALIDEAIIHRLIAARLAAVETANSAIAALQLGENDRGDALARLESIALSPLPRDRQGVGGPDQPDAADLTVVVVCRVSAGLSAAHPSAISTVTSQVRACFDDMTVQDPAQPTQWVHKIEFRRAVSESIAQADEQTLIQVARVTITGTAERLSGTSLTNDLV